MDIEMVLSYKLPHKGFKGQRGFFIKLRAIVNILKRS